MLLINRLVTYIGLFAVAACAGASPAVTPHSISAQYSLSYNGLTVAEINERYESRDNVYRIVSESNTVGLAALFRRQSSTLTSSGRVRDAGLQPERFEGQNRGRDTRHVIAVFDWPSQRLTLSFDDRTESAVLEAGTQDRLSLMYQFMFFDFGSLKQIDVKMTNGRKLEQYRYSVTPDAEIDTALGRISTLHLVKQRDADEAATEIWLSPRHHFFPVRVLIVESDGSRYEQTLTHLDLKP